MRKMIKLVVVILALSMVSTTAVAQLLKYEWRLDSVVNNTATLSALGLTSSRDLIITINEPIALNGNTAAAQFDAEVDRQMASETILNRSVDLRIAKGSMIMLYTTVEYEAQASGEKQIAMFATYQVFEKNRKVGEGEIVVVRADGPNDRPMMDSYSGDILTIAGKTEEAIAGSLTVE